MRITLKSDIWKIANATRVEERKTRAATQGRIDAPSARSLSIAVGLRSAARLRTLKTKQPNDGCKRNAAAETPAIATQHIMPRTVMRDILLPCGDGVGEGEGVC